MMIPVYAKNWQMLDSSRAVIRHRHNSSHYTSGFVSNGSTNYDILNTRWGCIFNRSKRCGHWIIHCLLNVRLMIANNAAYFITEFTGGPDTMW